MRSEVAKLRSQTIIGDMVLHVVANHVGDKRCKYEKVVEADHGLLVRVKLGAAVPFQLEHLLRRN